MDGPLLDDWYIGITVSPPYFEGGGRTLVIRWNEPGPLPDQRRVYTLAQWMSAEQITAVAAELLESYLCSRASGIRRVIARLERQSWLSL